MGACARAYIINTDINAWNVVGYMMQRFGDDNVRNTVESHSFEHEAFAEMHNGHIVFENEKGEGHNLFVMSNSSRFFNDNVPFKNDVTEGNYVYLSGGLGEEWVKLLKDIVAFFEGGYVDENDCDEEEPYYVPADDDLQPIDAIKMSVDELIAHYKESTGFKGSVVVIK